MASIASGSYTNYPEPHTMQTAEEWIVAIATLEEELDALQRRKVGWEAQTAAYRKREAVYVKELNALKGDKSLKRKQPEPSSEQPSVSNASTSKRSKSLGDPSRVTRSHSMRLRQAKEPGAPS